MLNEKSIQAFRELRDFLNPLIDAVYKSYDRTPLNLDSNFSAHWIQFDSGHPGIGDPAAQVVFHCQFVIGWIEGLRDTDKLHFSVDVILNGLKGNAAKEFGSRDLDLERVRARLNGLKSIMGLRPRKGQLQAN